MKKLLPFAFLTVCFLELHAQADIKLHKGKFKKKGFAPNSRSYKPDDWEKPYYDSAVKTAYPSALSKFPEKYQGKLIHLAGIVDSVFNDSSDNSNSVMLVVENKYWDYVEDYSIQDEILFVSPKGDGKFIIAINDLTLHELEICREFANEKKFLLIYGYIRQPVNNLPAILVQQVKYIDYKLYTTKVMSYDIERDNNGEVVTDKKGYIRLIDFKFLKVAKAGQNK
jgi:hypothetical protein